MSRPVARKKLSWLTFWGSGASESQIIAVNGDTSLRARVLVSEAEVEDHDDELTVLRVIGEYGFFYANAAASLDRPIVHVAGMLVRESLDVGVTPDLMSPQAIEEYPWSWLRSWTVLPDAVSSQGQSGLVDATTPGTALEKMDVRVKRKLRSGDELVFLTATRYVGFGGLTVPANAVAEENAWLRLRILVES